jgi:hypothetical protein
VPQSSELLTQKSCRIENERKEKETPTLLYVNVTEILTHFEKVASLPSPHKMVLDKLNVIDKLKGAAIFITHDTKIMPNQKTRKEKETSTVLYVNVSAVLTHFEKPHT